MSHLQALPPLPPLPSSAFAPPTPASVGGRQGAAGERPSTPAATARRQADKLITNEQMAQASAILRRLTSNYDARLVGQAAVRTSLLVTLIAEGHILLESAPGLAKTTAAATLAKTVDGTFVRIQCTPDLLPSDIVGTEVFDPRTAEFSTRLGPVHANFVLLDEINRSSAKTQSAMLEAMQERQTSIGGEVYPLPDPFMVLATQNPIEEEGTYPLPQAQMDRFLVKEIVTYPTPDEEFVVLDRIDRGILGPHASAVEPAVTLDDVRLLTFLATQVYVDDSIKHYAVALVQATRDTAQFAAPNSTPYLDAGASPRGAIALQQVARALALLDGRAFVVPEDVRAMATAVLRHRIKLNFQALADDIRPDAVVDAVLAKVPTP